MRIKVLLSVSMVISGCFCAAPALAQRAEGDKSIRLFRYSQKKRASIPRGLILVSDQASGVAIEAAAALQDGLFQMTGVKVSIRTTSEFQRAYVSSSDVVQILVGSSRLAKQKGINVRQDLPSGDHYIIRCDPKAGYIALLGNDAEPLRGTKSTRCTIFWSAWAAAGSVPIPCGRCIPRQVNCRCP